MNAAYQSTWLSLLILGGLRSRLVKSQVEVTSHSSASSKSSTLKTSRSASSPSSFRALLVRTWHHSALLRKTLYETHCNRRLSATTNVGIPMTQS